MEKIVRKRVVLIGKITIGIGLILFLVFYLNPVQIKETFLRANRSYLLAAVLLLPLNLFLQYSKWRLLSIDYFGVSESRKIWASLFYGISGGIFTPMKSGEYFARALPYNNVKVLDVILATLIDKMIPIIFVFLIGGMFFIIYLKMIIGFSLLAAIVLIIIYKLVFFSFLYFLLGNSRFTMKVREYLEKVKILSGIFERIAFLKNLNSQTILKVVSIGFLYHLTFTFQMTLLLIAYSGEVLYLQFFFVANLIIFAQIVIPPVALGEVGVREGAAVYFLHTLGFEGAIGFNAAISLFFINLLIPSIAGFFMLLKRN